MLCLMVRPRQYWPARRGPCQGRIDRAFTGARACPPPYAPQSWSVFGIKGLVTRGPVMIPLLWNAGEYTAGRGSSGHRMVIFGILTDNDPTGLGTLLHIHDPWAPMWDRPSRRATMRL